MKKGLFITAALMVAIIIIRMILSFTVSEQVAEVFCRVSFSFLLFYSIVRISKNKVKATI